MEASIVSQPPDHWPMLCGRHRGLFASVEWQTLLYNAFDAVSYYVIAAEEEFSFAVQVFRKGVFKAAYINFPLGGTLGGHLPHASCIELLQRHLPGGVQLIHLICPAFIQEEVDYMGTPITLPESAIVDLSSYSLLDKKKVRRDLKRAKQFGTQITTNTDPNQALTLYTLYKNTIIRHQGRIRYNLRYFQELIHLARDSDWVHVFTASLDNRIIGFLVLILHNDCAYYLHGASDRAYAKHGVSDLLIAYAIEFAEDQGLDGFNLMASPADQPSLIKYKEKWGATTQDQKHYQYFSHPGWKLAYRLGNSALNLLRG